MFLCVCVTQVCRVVFVDCLVVWVFGLCLFVVCVCLWCMCRVCVCADGSLMPVISSLGGGTVMRGDGSFSLPGGRGAGGGRQ